MIFRTYFNYLDRIQDNLKDPKKCITANCLRIHHACLMEELGYTTDDQISKCQEEQKNKTVTTTGPDERKLIWALYVVNVKYNTCKECATDLKETYNIPDNFITLYNDMKKIRESITEIEKDIKTLIKTANDTAETFNLLTSASSMFLNAKQNIVTGLTG